MDDQVPPVNDGVGEEEAAFLSAMEAMRDDVTAQDAETGSAPKELEAIAADKDEVEGVKMDEGSGGSVDGDNEGSAAASASLPNDPSVISSGADTAVIHLSVPPSASSAVPESPVPAAASNNSSVAPPTVTRDRISDSIDTSMPSTPVVQTSPETADTPTNDTPVAAAPQQHHHQPPPPLKTAGKRKRLPQDVIGQLEDRIAEDPRGDVDAWLGLIEEHKRKGKFDEARQAYERFFVIFPTAAQQWIAYINMELENNELVRVEHIFARCLLQVLNVDLWSQYLDYIRRRNNLINDPSGKARTTVAQAYDFVLNNVGCDREAGKIWSEHVQFVKSAPGNVGGNSWMDQQKMDSLRKVYQKAVTQPISGVEQLWREYDSFEQGLNKLTARKFLQERSPAFMTARGCLIELNNLTRGLRRETLPRLPPAPGFEGAEEWEFQIGIWKKWIAWEKDDPLVLAKEDPVGLRNRIVFAYKQALMAVRFDARMWFDAAEYCFEQEAEADGMDFLKQGILANPESCLLTFRYAERLEATMPVEDGEEGAVRRGQTVRRPYDELLNTLYTTVSKIQAREKEQLARIEDMEVDMMRSPRDEDEEEEDVPHARQQEREKQIAVIKDSTKAQVLNLSKTISAVWINLMRAMRRIQGHGRVNEPLGGSRQIFADARKRGKITSDVYVASALIEYHCYRDPAALKIFERGMKLFPEDEDFALEYLKHLVHINDITNARALFETFVGKVSADKCRRIYQYFYEYEAHYGELSQVYKLEKRMAELYPSDPSLSRFQTRYTYKNVNPCTSFTIVSPAMQCRPKGMILPLPPGNAQAQLPLPPPPPPPGMVVRDGPPVPGAAPAGPNPGTFTPAPPPPQPVSQNTRTNSPKRPAPRDDDDDFTGRVRKMARADSPLKGAAGRRLNQIKQSQRQQQQSGGSSQAQRRDRDDTGRNGTSIPAAIMQLLSVLPSADTYNIARFRPEAMVVLLAGLRLPDTTQNGGGYYPSR